jgi:ABC-type Zn uptake system ZnuABC Zn-binding protein ZnuA
LVIVDASAGITDVIMDTEHQTKAEAGGQRLEARTPESESPAPSPQPLAPTSGNPHIWLDPEYAKAGIKNLVTELVRLDPEGESLYRKREAAYLVRLDSLSAAISAEFAGLTDRRLITYHDAWPYFARRFGIDIIATVEPIPGQEPSARELTRLVDLIRRERIKVITTEPQLPSALPNMLAKETGVKVVVLNPLECEGGYIAALGNGANALRDALR